MNTDFLFVPSSGHCTGTYLLSNQWVVMNVILQDEQKELDEITAKRQKKGRNEEEAPGEEKTILHGTC